METRQCLGLVINAPEFFADADFQHWLKNEETKFTWYRAGAPDEWSDVVVLVDPGLNGEGSDSDMPAQVWDRIVQTCRKHLGPAPDQECHYMVRLTNLS